MTKIETRTVVVLYQERVDDGPFNLYGMPLNEFIAALEDLRDEIPEEYRDAAQIEVSSEADYDSYTPAIRITYTRPETPEEAETRAARVAASRRHELERLEAEMRRTRALMEKGE